MNAGIHQGYIKHLHWRQKETCITLCLEIIFWSEAILKTSVTLIRNKPKKVIVHITAKKSPPSSTIIHHHPPSSLWSSSLQTLLFTYIYRWMQRKIHVCDVNAKCTNTNGFHNCTARMDYYWNFQFFKVQRIGWSLHKNILLFLAQLQF